MGGEQYYWEKMDKVIDTTKCLCGNTKDKECFTLCRECHLKQYKKYYDYCVDCDKPKIKPRDREFKRCYKCNQVYSAMKNNII